MRSKGNLRWVAAMVTFAFFTAWALLAANLFINQGDRMIGFHPVILAVFPGVIIGSISTLILLCFRQWQIGISLGLGLLTLLLVTRNGHAIEQDAWRRTVERYAQGNEEAVASIEADLPGDNLFDLWDEKKLSPVKGFQWYGANHFGAPNGVYFGFEVGGIPHVRIQKIRHGWRGVALVRPDRDIAALTNRYGGKYSKIGSSDWYAWTIEQ